MYHARTFKNSILCTAHDIMELFQLYWDVVQLLIFMAKLVQCSIGTLNIKAQIQLMSQKE